MPSVELVLPLVTRKVHLVGVDNHNIITNVLMGGVRRFVLPAEDGCHGRCQSTDRLILGIDEMPCALEGSAGEGHGD